MTQSTTVRYAGQTDMVQLIKTQHHLMKKAISRVLTFDCEVKDVVSSESASKQTLYQPLNSVHFEKSTKGCCCLHSFHLDTRQTYCTPPHESERGCSAWRISLFVDCSGLHTHTHSKPLVCTCIQKLKPPTPTC